MEDHEYRHRQTISLTNLPTHSGLRSGSYLGNAASEKKLDGRINGKGVVEKNRRNSMNPTRDQIERMRMRKNEKREMRENKKKKMRENEKNENEGK